MHDYNFSNATKDVISFERLNKKSFTTHDKSRYHSNCGKFGYKYKFCKEPVTSYGVILIKFDYDRIKNIFSNMYSGANQTNSTNPNPNPNTNTNNTNLDINDTNLDTNDANDANLININNDRIHFENIDDIKLFSILQNQIKFLLICRKHTLGYSEFIRGHYKPDNIDGTFFLFQQMIKKEINKIEANKNNFSTLWDDFWIDPSKKILFDKDYKKSKQKFEMLNNSDVSEVTLDFYLDKVNPLWEQPEWGFPKGRKNKLESNIESATREFEEETGFSKNDYILLEGIRPMSEEFIGTNAIKYKHVYYIAYASSDKTPNIEENNLHQMSEIGDIGYFTFNEILGMIRPYQIDRKKIIGKVFMFTCEKIIRELKNDLQFIK